MNERINKMRIDEALEKLLPAYLFDKSNESAIKNGGTLETL
jgi:hypothetical protein